MFETVFVVGGECAGTVICGLGNILVKFEIVSFCGRSLNFL